MLSEKNMPPVIQALKYRRFHNEKMAKQTLFSDERALVGLNFFEPGQEHAPHMHEDMDKLYQVLAGTGVYVIC